MNFSQFVNKLPKLKKIALPGQEVQFEMAPPQRISMLKKMEGKKTTAKKAGVMALFYPNAKKETHLALILRKTSRGVHSGQVGFPGGRFEPEDISICNTALRETEEEIGVPLRNIEIVKELTEIYIPPSHFMMYPFVGIVRKHPEFDIQKTEVETLIEVELSHFLDDNILINKTITTSYAKNLHTPAFYLNHYVVWGATAMVLNELRFLLKMMYTT